MMNAHQRPAVGLRRILAAALAALLAMTVAACGARSADGDASASSDSGSWPRTIETDDGELVLDSQPRTIVSTSTTLTGSLLAVGAPVVASAATSPNVEGLSDENGFFVQWSDAARQRGVEKLYENSSPDVEKAGAYAPDLIVVAKNGGDSVADEVGKLREIAPVLVIDYTGRSWQDVTGTIAQATGREQQAEQIIADYDSRLSETKDAIAVPEGTTSAFIVFGDGTGAAALTKESAQGQILSSLEFALADIPDDVKGDTSMGADRQDIVNLSPENVRKGLTGDNWIVVSADQASRDAIANDPVFSTAVPVKEGRVTYTPPSTFRLDYYSALTLLDTLKDDYKKA